MTRSIQAHGQPRPLIIGLDINGWNVARGLFLEGIRPVALDDDPGSIFWRSRKLDVVYTRAYVGEPLLEAFGTLHRHGERYILISALEETVAWLNRNRDRVPAWIQLCFPEPTTLELLLDKRLFYEHARRIGLPIKSMYFFDSGWKLSGRPRPPCILKMRRKVHLPGVRKAYLIQNQNELVSLMHQLQEVPGIDPSNLIVQEWIPGQDSDVYFCMQYYDASGHRRASFTGRKIRQWRPLVGGTASAEPAHAPLVEELTSRLFESVRMRGIGSLEFKRDPADGCFYAIEPTACRADYQEGTAIANGCNIPYIMYRSECGEPIDRPCQPRGRPVIWVSARDDFQSARARSANSKLTYWRWWRSLKGPKWWAVWEPHDPWPFIELVRRKVAARLNRLLG